MMKGNANNKNEIVIKHATKMSKPIMHLTQTQPHNNNISKIFKTQKTYTSTVKPASKQQFQFDNKENANAKYKKCKRIQQ